MMKCDLHVHSNASDAIIRQAFTKLCGVRECYSDPDDIYRAAKEKGMGAVTITDHILSLDSARASFYLAKKYPHDCFTGGEYMVHDNELGLMLEVLCFNFNETQHEELFRLSKSGLGEFIGYAEYQGLPYVLAHPAWPVVLKPKLTAEAVYKWAMMFNVFEAINGDLERANDIAMMLASAKKLKPADSRRWWSTTGGSDAHVLSAVGRAYTAAPKARNKGEFLRDLKAGEVYGDGEYSALALFNEQIHEGISTYKRHEWQEIKRLGLREYAIKYPNKLVYMSIIPLLRPILPLAIATNVKTRLEEQAYDLEQKVMEHILKQEFHKEKIDIHRRIEKRKAELSAGRKEAKHYLRLPSGIRARIVEKIRGWSLAGTESGEDDEEGSGPLKFLGAAPDRLIKALGQLKRIAGGKADDKQKRV